MNSDTASTKTNPLETEKLPKLLISFCIPSLASSLVTSVYNIVDQMFIGNVLGIIGNAAVNVVFPAVTLITALSLMCGVGTSAAMNLSLGNGDEISARKAVGGGFGLMILSGAAVSIPMLLWTRQLLQMFGCTETVMPYALPYARIIAGSFVFAMIAAAGPFLIRADGNAKYGLWCMAVSSLLNVVLDAIFILGFGWGICGAAWATLIAEGVGAFMVIWYMARRFRAFQITGTDFLPDFFLYAHMAAIGAGPAFNFMTQALVQVFLNNALRVWGAASVYGSDACLGAAGVAAKVNMLATAMVVGLTNGLQPISSYNYGRKNYRRVADASKMVIGSVLICSFIIFLCYQLFPIQITSLFGSGDAEYYEFAARFFRTFYLLIGIQGLQSSVAGFFSSQGKVKKAITISLVRQVLFFPLLLLLMPKFFGLEGVLWSGPIADLAMAAVAVPLYFNEMKKLQELAA